MAIEIKTTDNGITMTARVESSMGGRAVNLTFEIEDGGKILRFPVKGWNRLKSLIDLEISEARKDSLSDSDASIFGNVPLRVQVEEILRKEKAHLEDGVWYFCRGRAYESIPTELTLEWAMDALHKFRGAYSFTVFGNGTVEVTVGIHDAKTYYFKMTPPADALCSAILAHNKRDKLEEKSI